MRRRGLKTRAQFTWNRKRAPAECQVFFFFLNTDNNSSQFSRKGKPNWKGWIILQMKNTQSYTNGKHVWPPSLQLKIAPKWLVQMYLFVSFEAEQNLPCFSICLVQRKSSETPPLKFKSLVWHFFPIKWKVIQFYKTRGGGALNLWETSARMKRFFSLGGRFYVRICRVSNEDCQFHGEKVLF